MATRGFKVDYGTKKTDPLRDKIHTLETRGDVVGQYQVDPADGKIHWFPVQNPVRTNLMSPADPARFLYGPQLGSIIKKRGLL